MSAEQPLENEQPIESAVDLTGFEDSFTEFHETIAAFDQAQVSYLAACDAYFDDPDVKVAYDMQAYAQELGESFGRTVKAIWDEEPDMKLRIKLAVTIMFTEEKNRKAKMREKTGCKKYKTFADDETEFAQIMEQAFLQVNDPDEFKGVVVATLVDDVNWDFKHLSKKHSDKVAQAAKTPEPANEAKTKNKPSPIEALGGHAVRAAKIGGIIGTAIGASFGVGLNIAESVLNKLRGK